jgi:hypothetical protein
MLKSESFNFSRRAVSRSTAPGKKREGDLPFCMKQYTTSHQIVSDKRWSSSLALFARRIETSLRIIRDLGSYSICDLPFT